MEKYAVELEEEQVKTGSTVRTCPGCGDELKLTPNQPPYCLKCGVEPFSKKPKK